MDSLKTNDQNRYSRARDITFSIPQIFLTLRNITHNAPQLLSDITGGNWSDYMRLPLEPQMLLNHPYARSRTPQDL